MTTIIKFTYPLGCFDGYKCDRRGDLSGEYVPVAEYIELQATLLQEQDKLSQALSNGLNPYLQTETAALRALIQRVVEIGPKLTDIALDGVESGTSPELTQLLKDCEAVVK